MKPYLDPLVVCCEILDELKKCIFGPAVRLYPPWREVIKVTMRVSMNMVDTDVYSLREAMYWEFVRRVLFLSSVIGRERTMILISSQSVSSRILNDDYFDCLLFFLFFQL